MKRLVLILIVAVVAFAAGVIVQRYYPLGRLIPRSSSAAAPSHIAQRVAVLDSLPPSSPGGTVFFGDSLVEWGHWPERWSSPAVCRGVAGATVDDARSLAPAVARCRPSLVVIQCGTNDLLAGHVPAAEYTALVHSLLDTTDARLVVCEVPGFARHVAESARRNELVATLNAHLRTLVGPRVSVVAVPLAESDYASDGVHLSPSGYAAWERSLAAVK